MADNERLERYRHLRNRLFRAICCLAISAAPIQRRLTAAAGELRVLFAHEFPPKMRTRFAALTKTLLARPPDWTSPRELSDDEARKVAAEILWLYHALVEAQSDSQTVTSPTIVADQSSQGGSMRRRQAY
jgi:hypothetical protein